MYSKSASEWLGIRDESIALDINLAAWRVAVQADIDAQEDAEDREPQFKPMGKAHFGTR